MVFCESCQYLIDEKKIWRAFANTKHLPRDPSLSPTNQNINNIAYRCRRWWGRFRGAHGGGAPQRGKLGRCVL